MDKQEPQTEQPRGDVTSIANMLSSTALGRMDQTPPIDEGGDDEYQGDNLDDNSPDGGDAGEDTSTPEEDDDFDGDTDPSDDSDGDQDTDPEEDEGGDEEELDAGEEGEDGDFEEVAYSDDDVVEVTVDGETKEVSLRDLKAAYSGEGAIDKRLKEATEARKEATSLREQAATEVEQQRTRLLQTITQLDGALFAPMVDKPDPKLRQTNMQEYLNQKDAYEEDQKRIETSRQQMAHFIQQQQQEQNQVRQRYRQEEQQRLVEAIPELKDPKQAPRVQEEISFAAQHYGFTPEQVAEVDNHAVFLMARDAGRYLRMQKLKDEARNSPKRGSEGGKKKKRKLTAGQGSTTAKTNAWRKAQQRKQAEDKARQTGKPGDVAGMLTAGVKTRSKK